jgi:hypothetical protein
MAASRIQSVALTFFGDALLAGALLLAIGADQIGRQGFASDLVSAAEFRDWLLILAGWGTVMTAIAVAGLIRRRPEIAVLQAAAIVVVLALFAPTLTRGRQESHPAPPAPPTTAVTPYCPHGNCPGG